MGLDLRFEAGGQVFGTRFSPPDWDTIELLKEHLPVAIAACFDVEEFGEPVVVSLATLRVSVEHIDRWLAEHPELLPYTYQSKVEYIVRPGDGLGGHFDTGGLSGIRLPGDEDHWYAVHAGLNELRLEKRDGSGEVVEERDLRNEKELMTVNMGLMQFRKRRAKTSLRRTLKEMQQFFTSVTASEVVKTLG